MVTSTNLSRPIEACVVILPVFEFLRTNPTFPLVLISPLDDTKSSAISSPPYTILSLSSYLLTHASSTSSPRAIGYANLCLNTLLTLVQNDGVLIAFSQPSDERIRLCRQVRLLVPVGPTLLIKLVESDYLCYPFHRPGDRPSAHYWIASYSGSVTTFIKNWKCSRIREYIFHRDGAPSYVLRTCIWVCHRVVWFLHKAHIRLGTTLFVIVGLD